MQTERHTAAVQIDATKEMRTHTERFFFLSFLCLCTGTSDVRSSVCFTEDEKQVSQVDWGQCGRGKLVAGDDNDDDVTTRLTCEGCLLTIWLFISAARGLL